MHKASVDRCACVGVCVLPTVLSVRLQVVCSVEEDGEPHLSLLGCRMELVGSLMNRSSKEGPSQLRKHRSSYKPEHQTQFQLFNLVFWTGKLSSSEQGLIYKPFLSNILDLKPL